MSSPTHRVRVWDLPTRIFHWALVFSFVILWITHESDELLDFHVFAGYLFLGLLIFRLIWGMIGTEYAKFRHFLYGWRSVRNYLGSLFTAHPQHFLGHNPAGSLAIWLILIVGLISALSGLMLLGAEEQHGLLAGWFSFEQSVMMRIVHTWSSNLMLLIVIVHVCGVIVASGLHHENLARAMVTGWKFTDVPHSSVALHGVVAGSLLLVMIGFTSAYFRGYVTATPEHPYLPFVGVQLQMNSEWQTSCGECHLAYHPSLLPSRAWKQLFAEQHEHFGEDLALETELLQVLTTYAMTHAAEFLPTEAAWKISRQIPPTQTPLRITETEYWKWKHREIPEFVWKYPNIRSHANCAACHLDAQQGTFEDGAMRIPASRVEK
jgi:cytochrome b